MLDAADRAQAQPYIEHTYSSRRRRKRESSDSQAASSMSDQENQSLARHSESSPAREALRPVLASIESPRQPKPLTQMHLDFGQADFSVKTCSACHMQYAPGEPKDEKTHAAYHAALLTGIRFQGWQSERVAQHCGAGSRILLVLPTDPPAHWRKVREVTNFMEDQLGFGSSWLVSVPCKVLLFVGSNARVQGCLVTETITSATLATIKQGILNGSTDLPGAKSTERCSRRRCSDGCLLAACARQPSRDEAPGAASSCKAASRLEDTPHQTALIVKRSSRQVHAACGVRAIWVSRSYTRQGVATKLLDAARCNCVTGYIVPNHEIAFSNLSADGISLAYYYSQPRGTIRVYSAA
ncbi:hypothetical protein WJX84_001662 [Apatococcus fuscideae]|uniref:Uncharacterized protein n=1 Tax=Apatococcus fuscideae TaxID=2026836 RepID=A0AAW1T4G6_9CHLO